MTGLPAVIEMGFIVLRNALIRKYRLETFENWDIRLSGMKVIRLYFVVRMAFDPSIWFDWMWRGRLIESRICLWFSSRSC